jgi:FkbH-like protein
LDCFDVVALTEEDRRRGQMYREDAQRQQFLDTVAPASLEEFYRSLRMSVAIRAPDNYAVPRFAQLTQRTNQFNFTTRRYSDADIRAMLADPSIGMYTISLNDRFGDLGVIGAAIVRRNATRWHLDTFLMSCRALGRGVEDAFLASLATDAAELGAILHATYIPTKKNPPARQFLERLNIQLQPGESTESEFTIEPGQVSIPGWIQLSREESRA